MNAKMKKPVDLPEAMYEDFIRINRDRAPQLREGQVMAVPGGTLEVMTIDPEYAALLMNHKHPNQRSVRGNHVEELSQDMKNGRWRYTMAPILLDKELRVIDGQHRLLAIIKSGTSHPFLMGILTDPQAFYAIDQGVGRSLNDVRQTLGKKIIHRTISGAILLEHRGFAARSLRTLSKEETDRILDEFPYMEELTELDRIGRKTRVHGVGSMAAAIAALRANRAEAMKFFGAVFSLTAIIDGKEAPQAYVLYLFLQSTKEAGAGRTTGEHYLLEAAYKSLRAWNAYRKGEMLHRLIYDPGAKMPKAMR